MSSPAAAACSSTGCSVKVIAKTWARDSHDLFDFESTEVRECSFELRHPATCARVGDDVVLQHAGPSSARGSEPLLSVVQRDHAFYVDKAAACRRLWLVIRDVAPNGYRLRVGECFKLGRFKFRVRQLVDETGGGAQPDLSLEGMDATYSYDPEQCIESMPCRICLMEGPGEDDPLIKPCKCKGSIEYVHLKCLRYWTKSRLQSTDAGQSDPGSYFYRPLTCELCLSSLPAFIMPVGGKSAPLLEAPPTKPPFVVLESVSRDSRRHSRGLHVVSLAGKACTLGRSHDSDVRIADVSISRCHATISYEQGHFVLRDNKSKFGTLVALNRPLPVGAGRKVSLQVGRTVVSLAPLREESGCLDVFVPCPRMTPAITGSDLAEETQ
mmetsp:Transcript_87167/g.251392  ORF Transcript_87167/g.251392 Transcript_87167/m.251392 type:complete len:382 (+) Transcript_87167:175-1320(+)